MTASLQPTHTNPSRPTLGRLAMELDGTYPGYSMLDLTTDVRWKNAKVETEKTSHAMLIKARAEGLGIEAHASIVSNLDSEKANRFLPNSIRLTLTLQDSASYRLKIVALMGPPGYQDATLEVYRIGREVCFPLAGYPHKLRVDGWLEGIPWRGESDIPGSPPEDVIRGHTNLGGAVASALLYVGLSFDWKEQKFLELADVTAFRRLLVERTRERTTID